MHFPSEIILQALTDLSKTDLKASRLVNRQWSSCAAIRLFDTLYISPHKTNIDVFQSVTQHPILRGYVKKLTYDKVGFSTECTYSDYFTRLLNQVAPLTHGLEGTSDSPDMQINSFIEAATRYYNSRQSLEKVEEECSNFDFIKAGYKKWQGHAQYEQKCMKKYEFMRILTMGLQRLNRLSTVILNDDWPCIGNLKNSVDIPVHRNGSPLARSWGLFDATPGTSDLAFWIITFALSTSEKRIHNFETWSGVSTATFDTQSKATERMLLHGVKAFAWLKKLRLNILSGENDTRNPDEYGDARYPDEYRNLSGLPILLDRMRDLEVLELYIPHDYMDASHPQGIYFKYESIFPKDGAWPHLRTFSLREIEIRDRDLVHLVFARMPSLQHLQIEDVELLDGNWESVIEALKFRRLSSLDMRSSRNLLYDDGKNFLSWLRDHVDGDAGKDFFDNLERYVVHGLQDVTLRHPSLEHNQPTQDSLDYLCGIFDQANGIRCIEDIDFAELKKNVAKACAEENRERQMA